MSGVLRAAMCVGLACAAVPGHPWAAGGTATAPGTTVRVGSHPGFGRVVFDLPPGATYNLVTAGDRVLLVFQGAGGVVEPSALPRNVRSIHTGEDSATLDLAPGSRARPSRLGDRLVIDVLDRAPGARPQPRPPAPPSAPAPAAAAGNSHDAPATPPATVAVPPPQILEQPARPAPVPVDTQTATPAPVVPVIQEALSSAPAPVAAQTEPAAAPSFLIQADGDVGVAAFRRGTQGVIVLDRRLPRQAVPDNVAWTQAAVGTVLQVPLAAEAGVRLTRVDQGWSVDLVPTSAAGTLQASPVLEGLGVPLPRPGRMVTVLDPLSGGTLLVGASLAAGPDTGLREERRTPDYRVLPSWQGVVVEPLSDQVDLRSLATGFLVTGGAPARPSATTLLSRRFDLQDEPDAATLNRMRAQLAGAAAAPPRARSRDRLAAVQSMIALGLGAEAQALVQVVAAEDPQAAADAETGALGAMAAVLAARPQEAAALDDSRLDGTDEVTLWRGLRDRRLDRDTAASRSLGTMAALAMGYPAALRRLVWPEVAEAAVESGTNVPTDRLPPYAAALRLERSGKVEEALAAFDAMVAGADRLNQVRAAARAAELRLASGRVGPADVASVLERQSVAWRGDAREARFLLRAASLRAAARQWRPALEALRAIEATFPDQKTAVQASKATVMQALLAAEGAGLSALDLVLLAADYADCVPEGPAGAAMAGLLADKLTALDLPARTIPVLQGLMRAAPPGEARAAFGVQLGQLLLDGGDPAGALAALEASTGPGLSPALQERRALVQSRLLAAKGDVPAAAALLLQIGTAPADDLRATLQAAAGNWTASLAATTDLVAKRVPRDGALPAEGQELLLRQAYAAAQAKDSATLRTLAGSASRIEGARGDVFRLLTAPPLDGIKELPRSSRELAAARTLPQHLQTIGMR